MSKFTIKEKYACGQPDCPGHVLEVVFRSETETVEVRRESEHGLNSGLRNLYKLQEARALLEALRILGRQGYI